MNKEVCAFPDGFVIKPDGVHELDPCVYEEVERYCNVTVSIRRCIRCGKTDIVWFVQDNTEQLDVD